LSYILAYSNDFSNPDISDITPVTSFGCPDLSIEAPSTIKKNPLSFCFNLFTALSVISTNFGFLSGASICNRISLSANNPNTCLLLEFCSSFLFVTTSYPSFFNLFFKLPLSLPKYSAPPPSSTSTLCLTLILLLYNCLAISSFLARSSPCDAYAAGVASVISAVDTRPVDLPFSLACSNTVLTLFLLASTPIAPLYVFCPELNAVAPAAESVTFSFGSLGFVR